MFTQEELKNALALMKEIREKAAEIANGLLDLNNIKAARVSSEDITVEDETLSATYYRGDVDHYLSIPLESLTDLDWMAKEAEALRQRKEEAHAKHLAALEKKKEEAEAVEKETYLRLKARFENEDA